MERGTTEIRTTGSCNWPGALEQTTDIAKVTGCGVWRGIAPLLERQLLPDKVAPRLQTSDFRHQASEPELPYPETHIPYSLSHIPYPTSEDPTQCQLIAVLRVGFPLQFPPEPY